MLFALEAQDAEHFLACEDNDEVIELVEEVEERRDLDNLFEFDKSWDALHRCFTDRDLASATATFPCHMSSSAEYRCTKATTTSSVGAGIVHLTLHAPGPSQAMAAPWGDVRTLTKRNLARVWQCSGPEFRRAVRWLDGKVLTGKPTVLDLLDARARATVGVGLHCLVSSLYTLAEVDVAGSECPDGGYRLETESVHGEIVDDEVVLTPSVNRAMPLLRCSD
ncbi:DUF1877 family protein [Streptomyces mirabilis]|uniref:DUF1877 family protein n=1 Tax=Streptomyces mirabilis TaxID=68239 RepID=UPI0033B15DEA